MAPADVDPAIAAHMVAGAADYHAGRFWHAHESWELAWHALRKAGDGDAAEFVHGMILVTAGFENARRGKEKGSKRQLASGIHLIRGFAAAAPRVGVVDAGRWADRLVDVYLSACRELRWTRWAEGAWVAPPVDVDAAEP